MACGIAASTGLFVACFGATEVRLVLTTDLPCTAQATTATTGTARTISTRIYLGAQTASGAVASADQCAAGTAGAPGELGDLVLTPSGARDAKVTVTVALAVDKDPDACFPPGSSERCIIARRAVSFSKHQARTIDIRLAKDCIGVACDPASTCYAGQCVAVELFCDAVEPCRSVFDAGEVADAAAEAGAPDAAVDAPPDAPSPFDAGPPAVAAGGRTYVAALAADASGLYWSEPGGYSNANGAIYRAASGVAAQALATGRESPGVLSLDGTSVYWMELLGAGIVRVPKSGGAAAVVPLGGPGLGVNATYVLVDPGYVFWNNEAVGASSGALTRIHKDGTQRTTLATMADGPWAVAEDAQSLVWVTGPRFGGMGSVSSISKLGGAPSIVSTTETSAPTARLAAANGNVAWASTAAGGSIVIRRAGKAAITIATGQGTTTSIAADDQAVYWLHLAGAGTGALEKATWDGAVVTFRSGLKQPGSVALDASRVYFVDNRDSSELVATAEIASLPR
jgi:hypothetical protein